MLSVLVLFTEVVSIITFNAQHIQVYSTKSMWSFLSGWSDLSHEVIMFLPSVKKLLCMGSNMQLE